MLSNYGGVNPLHIEPLHSAERGALRSMAAPGHAGGGGMVDAQAMLRGALANPGQTAQAQINPMAQDYMGRAGSHLERGLAAYSRGDIQPYMSDHASAVGDVARSRLSEYGDKLRAQISAQEGQRGARSFGSAASGTRMGEIDRELLAKDAEITAQYAHLGFQDAINQLNADRNRAVSGASVYGGLAGQAQGLQDTGFRTAVGGIGNLFQMGQAQTSQVERNMDRQLGAGRYVRDFNQGLANAIASDMLAEQEYPRQNVANTLGLLQSYESGQNQQPASPSTLGRIGGGLSAFGGLDDKSLNAIGEFFGVGNG